MLQKCKQKFTTEITENLYIYYIIKQQLELTMKTFNEIVKELVDTATISKFLDKSTSIEFTFIIDENVDSEKLSELIEDLCNEREMDITEAVSSPIFEGADYDENFHRYDVTLTTAYED